MSINTEGMTREGRRRTILEKFFRGVSMTECYKLPKAAEATHMLKRQEIEKLTKKIPEFEEQDRVNVKQIVEAMVWFNRDISLFRGRPLALLDRILLRFDAAAENIWLNVSKIVEHVQTATLYVHIGGGTVVRVLGSPIKMYISEHSDFYDVAPRGFFLENYYIRENGDNNRTFTMNIIREEMEYDFPIKEAETAIAFMLTRHMGRRCAEVMQGVIMCQKVASYVAEEAKTGGTIVSTGVELDCDISDLAARLLQTFGAKEDFDSKADGESAAYQRLSGLSLIEALPANMEWLSGVAVLKSEAAPSAESSPECDVGYIFAEKKVFKRSIMKTICVASLLVALVVAASWATISQEISGAERLEKWLTLALFGCFAIALSLIGSDRRRDLLRELWYFRTEVFDSAGMAPSDLRSLLRAICVKKKRRESISKKNCGWLGSEIDGSFEIHRVLRTSEIPESRLLLRKNGDITFSWAGRSGRSGHAQGERFVSLETNGVLKVGREAGAESGIILECGRGVGGADVRSRTVSTNSDTVIMVANWKAEAPFIS